MALTAVPVKYRRLYGRALAGELSPRQAIKAKCQECVGWEDVRPRVGGCTVRACPLWPLRPYQDARGRRHPPEGAGSGEEVGSDGPRAVHATPATHTEF